MDGGISDVGQKEQVVGDGVSKGERTEGRVDEQV